MRDLKEDLIKSNYLFKNEKDSKDVFKRVAKALSGKDEAREKRLYSYMVDEKFMFATPILANIGTDRGLPISCFVNEVADNREGIFSTYNEINHLSSDGGGIGTCWSIVREIGSTITNKGKSSGVIPFIKVTESLAGAVSQGGLRRASQAAYLHISHPEIEEFISIRREFGADLSRRCPHLHHGVIINDKFMQAVINNDTYQLISPKDNKAVKNIQARGLWFKILKTRIETGEPYIIFEDNVNKNLPKYYKDNNYKINTSNLCTEIFQHTSTDKTAVCALGSINLVKWDLIKDDDLFFKDIIFAMNEVLNEFVAKVKDKPAYSKALKSVCEERNIGIGVMGYHSYLQSKMIPFGSVASMSLTKLIFKEIKAKVDLYADEYAIMNVSRVNVLKTAIAPTSSISIICGTVSAGIEPYISNIFTHKLGTGSYIVKNPYLDKYLIDNKLDYLWDNILQDNGSVKNIKEIPQEVKEVFETAFEIDQRWIIKLAALRQPYIDQGQSLNLFLQGNIHKQTLNDLHIDAWKQDIKSLYYVRSTSVKEVGLSKKIEREIIKEYDECLACQ